MAWLLGRPSPLQLRQAWRPLWPSCATRSRTRWVRGHGAYFRKICFFFKAEARKHSAWLTAYLFCFLSQRGLCCVAQLWTLSEDCCANELSQCSDGLHGPLHWTVCFCGVRSAAVDLCCYCWDFPLFITSRNGKGTLKRDKAGLIFSSLHKNLLKMEVWLYRTWLFPASSFRNIWLCY